MEKHSIRILVGTNKAIMITVKCRKYNISLKNPWGILISHIACQNSTLATIAFGHVSTQFNNIAPGKGVTSCSKPWNWEWSQTVTLPFQSVTLPLQPWQSPKITSLEGSGRLPQVYGPYFSWIHVVDSNRICTRSERKTQKPSIILWFQLLTTRRLIAQGKFNSPARGKIKPPLTTWCLTCEKGCMFFFFFNVLRLWFILFLAKRNAFHPETKTPSGKHGSSTQVI